MLEKFASENVNHSAGQKNISHSTDLELSIYKPDPRPYTEQNGSSFSPCTLCLGSVIFYSYSIDMCLVLPNSNEVSFKDGQARILDSHAMSSGEQFTTFRNIVNLCLEYE